MASEKKQKLERDLLVRNRLLAERDVVKRFVEDYDHSLDSSRIPVHLNILTRIEKEFDAVHSRIELTDSLDRLEAHLLVRSQFFDQSCKLKGSLLSKSSRNHRSHVPPAHRKPPTVPVRAQVPQKEEEEVEEEEEEEAIFMVAGKSRIPVARAATPKPEPNAPGNVSRHSPSQFPTANKQSASQQPQELVSVRSLRWNPVLPDRQAEESSSCSLRSRPPEEVASIREASGPFVRSNPSQQPIPSTSAHVGTSGSAHPVDPSPPSQAEAIHVQGEKVHPPIGDLNKMETRSEVDEEGSSQPGKLSAASIATPVVTRTRNEAVVHAEEEPDRYYPGIPSNPKAASAAQSVEIATLSNGILSAPKAAPAAPTVRVPSRPEIEEEVVRRVAPADGGNPDQASTPPDDSAEKVLRERDRAVTSKRARRKIEPIADPPAVLPSTNVRDASSAQGSRYLSIGDGLPLEIGRNVDISAPVSSAIDAIPPVSQPPNPSRVPSHPNSAQPSCGKLHEATATRIRPGKHTLRFLSPVCPLVAIRCSHAPARARVRSCRVRRERTAPTVHRQNRFPSHAHFRSNRTVSRNHYHATRETEAHRRISVGQSGEPRNPVRPANRPKPSSQRDYKLPPKPPDDVSPSVRCPLRFPDPTTGTRRRICTRAEKFPCEERCHPNRAATEVATDPARIPSARKPPESAPSLFTKPHTPKYGTITASPKLSAVEAPPSVQERRWKYPPWPSEVIRRSWHTAAPLETTETLQAVRIASILAQPCSRGTGPSEDPEKEETHECCSTKTGRADRI